MIELFQGIVSGILVGGLFGVLALCIVIVVKATHVFNLAQGWLVMTGAYMLWEYWVAIGLPFWLAIILTLATSAALGLVIERVVMRPLIGQPFFAPVLASLGVGYVLWGGQMLVWPGQGRRYPDFIPDTPIRIGDLLILQQHMWAFVVCVIILLLFVLFFHRTGIGLAMRATAADPQAAQSMGIPVKRVFALTWALAAMISTIGGIMWGAIAQITPTLAETGLQSFAPVMLGGMESILGAVVGSLIVGILQKVGAIYLDPLVQGGAAEVIPYVVLLIVLIVIPYGLFGNRRIERV